MEEQKIELKIINMADIQSQEIEWLWYPFIPYGRILLTLPKKKEFQNEHWKMRKKSWVLKENGLENHGIGNLMKS